MSYLLDTNTFIQPKYLERAAIERIDGNDNGSTETMSYPGTDMPSAQSRV